MISVVKYSGLFENSMVPLAIGIFHRLYWLYYTYVNFSTYNTHYSISTDNSVVSDEYGYLIQQTWNKYKMIFTICYIHIQTNLDLVSDELFGEKIKKLYKKKRVLVSDAS